MKDRGQPPLFMAYWLWAAVYLFAVVANGVLANPVGRHRRARLDLVSP